MRQPLIFFIFLMSFTGLVAQKAPSVYGLNYDDERKGNTSVGARVTAVAQDTLELPFFDDFTGYDRKFDSIVIKNAQPVRLYSKLLDTLGTAGTVIISFPDTITNGLNFYYKIFGTAHLQQESSGVYVMDTTQSGFVSPVQFPNDTVMYSVYWMQKGKYYLQLDSYLWETENTGVYLNNRFCKSPPSHNVVTFDGLKANGVPYNAVTTGSVGITDFLTSRVIRLDSSRYVPSDSLYLSFYYQNQGYGEIPDPTDYLQLQMLDTSGTWLDVWSKSDTLARDTFSVANVVIKDPAFFHKGFQFRFRSYGRQAGMYDVWNLDYIYLNKNRSHIYKSGQDWAIGEMDASFLNNFTAIPYRHYEPVKASQSDSISFTIMNLRSYNQASIDLNGSAVDNTGVILDDNTFIASYLPGGPLGSGRYKIRNYFTPNISNLTGPLTDLRLIYQSVSIVAKDSALAFIHNNNFAVTNTNLINFYSYDDNTAETGIGFEYIGAKMGNQYTFLQDDTMTHVEFKFVRGRGKDMEGRSILLKIWNKNFVELRSQVVKVNYSSSVYTLNDPLPVVGGDAYYVGYQQNFVDLLTVGFDRNTRREDKIYYDSGSEFVQYSLLADADSGALMIRPYFVKTTDVFVGTKDPLQEQIVSLYPMPVTSILNIEGRLGEVKIYNVLGEEVFSKILNPSESSHQLDLSTLSNGVFILRSGSNAVRIIKQ